MAGKPAIFRQSSAGAPSVFRGGQAAGTPSVFHRDPVGPTTYSEIDSVPDIDNLADVDLLEDQQ